MELMRSLVTFIWTGVCNDWEQHQGGTVLMHCLWSVLTLSLLISFILICLCSNGGF